MSKEYKLITNEMFTGLMQARKFPQIQQPIVSENLDENIVKRTERDMKKLMRTRKMDPSRKKIEYNKLLRQLIVAKRNIQKRPIPVKITNVAAPITGMVQGQLMEQPLRDEVHPAGKAISSRQSKLGVKRFKRIKKSPRSETSPRKKFARVDVGNNQILDVPVFHDPQLPPEVLMTPPKNVTPKKLATPPKRQASPPKLSRRTVKKPIQDVVTEKCKDLYEYIKNHDMEYGVLTPGNALWNTDTGEHYKDSNVKKSVEFIVASKMGLSYLTGAKRAGTDRVMQIAEQDPNLRTFFDELKSLRRQYGTGKQSGGAGKKKKTTIGKKNSFRPERWLHPNR